MTHDITPLKQVLDEVTEESQDGIYTLLANWNTPMANAKKQSGDRFRDVFWDYFEDSALYVAS